ncbi:MAG: response regulator [candidate division Zixibacteria bacterium]|nr:response regulator [candidate division Zixibacteria bacterium]
MANILLIDDEEEFTEVLSARMETRGFNVDVASSGEEGIDKAKAKSYDAVILDMAMPGMDGMETLKHLLNIRPGLQIIMLTGHATVNKGVEAVKLGAADFLEKPAEINLLVEKIKQAQEKTEILFEQQLDKKLSDIMKKKGW